MVDADARPPGSPPQSSRRFMAATPPLDADSPPLDKVTPGTTDSWDLVDGEDNGLGHFLAQASDPPLDGDQADQDDTYQVISSNTARGPDKQLRVHLLTLEGFCLGCGWRARSTAPEDGERPVKTTRKVSVDGWDRADEEETRPDLRLTKEALDEWYEWFYGEDITGRRPPHRKKSSSSRSAMPGARFMTWSTQAPHSPRPCPSSAATTFSGRKRFTSTATAPQEPPPRGWGKPWTQVWQTQWDKPAKGGKDRGRKGRAHSQGRQGQGPKGQGPVARRGLGVQRVHGQAHSR